MIKDNLRWLIRSTTNAVGSLYEQQAKRYLQQQGLQAVCDNYRSRFGEIDLIMSDHGTLVFIEVKYRQRTDYGGAAAAVNGRKQQKLIRTAYSYLQSQGWTLQQTACRFDVVAIEGDGGRINWIKNAFQEG